MKRSLDISPELSLPLSAATQTFGILAKKREAQVAWAAGLFEGEGCISHDVQKRGKRRALTLVSTDRDVIAAFHAVVGVGAVRVRNNGSGNPRHKMQWQWNVARWADVQRTLQLLLPFFGDRRRAKALALLADPAGRQGIVCGRGHPLRGPGADVYVNGRSAPQCAVCARERSRRARRPPSRADDFVEAVEL